MRLTIELSPAEASRLTAQAAEGGVDLEQMIHDLVVQQLPEKAEVPSISPGFSTRSDAHTMLTHRNAAAIALLRSWIEQDATEDPDEILRANEDLEELKRNLNANRGATGERLVFP